MRALTRLHAWGTAGWRAVAGGAGLGFLARDVLQLGPAAVAVAWLTGASLGLASGSRTPCRRIKAAASSEGELGQASVEWTALVLAAGLALGALASFGPEVEGRSLGGFLGHQIVCAATGRCRDGDRALATAYGASAAALVRAHAPNVVYEPGERQLPVDWRRCRRADCARAPDDPGLDVHRSDHGEAATVFTRVLRRGGRTYLEYWLYFPNSHTTVLGSDKFWAAAWLLPRLTGLVERAPRYPGYHRDDWEAYVVRLVPDGSAWVRTSSHGHWQGCKHKDCRGEWTASTGWTRVSRGSHAGHIPLRTELVRRSGGAPGVRKQTSLLPGRDLSERTTTAEGLRLVPLETTRRRRYRPNGQGIAPPWRKDAYRDPESETS